MCAHLASRVPYRQSVRQPAGQRGIKNRRARSIGGGRCDGAAICNVTAGDFGNSHWHCTCDATEGSENDAQRNLRAGFGSLYSYPYPNPKNSKAMATSRLSKPSKLPAAAQEFHLGKKAKIGTSGAVVGAIVAGPIGALVGGVLGTALGAAASIPSKTATSLKKRATKPKPRKSISVAKPKKAALKKTRRGSSAKKR